MDFGNASRVRTTLTGIKPSNMPHLGNYLGAIKPALELADTHRSLYFIADYHALTAVHDPKLLRAYTYDVAATWLACGLDPKSTIFYRQSAIPEVFELAWVLSCFLAAGQLERGHSYKDAIAKGEAPSAGLFNYPVLMAADICLYDAHVVPVGKDQKQHLELARDVAMRINHHFGEGTLVVPEARVQSEVLVPGLDGRKMSKSYGNTIPLFASDKELKALIMKVPTGSEPLEAPKEPEGALIYDLTRSLAPGLAPTMAEKLRAGGHGWGHAKQELLAALGAMIAPMRERFEALRRDEGALDRVLEEGEARAREIAHATMTRVRGAIGMSGRI